VADSGAEHLPNMHKEGIELEIIQQLTLNMAKQCQGSLTTRKAVGLCGKKGKFPVTIQDTLSPTIMNNSSQEFYMGEIVQKIRKRNIFHGYQLV
jgi:hypothetical protein